MTLSVTDRGQILAEAAGKLRAGKLITEDCSPGIHIDEPLIEGAIRDLLAFAAANGSDPHLISMRAAADSR